MKFEHIEIGGRKFMTVRGEVVCPGYMPEMVMKNIPGNMVPFNFTESGKNSKAMYETDIWRTLKDYLMENGADEQWIKRFLISVDGILALCGEFLIDPDFIMMNAELIFLAENTGSIRYIFNPFENKDFHGACRKMLVDIAGNYFVDHAVSGEVFRERLLREVGRKDFNARNLLARWDSLSFSADNETGSEKQRKIHIPIKKKDYIKSLINRKGNKEEESNETQAITSSTKGMCLTGICSINTRILIKKEGVTVGRGMLQKNYGLYNSGIGKAHARVYVKDGSVYATDLGSRNGTYLNGEKLDKRIPVKIERGDILAFSDEEFILC